MKESEEGLVGGLKYQEARSLAQMDQGRLPRGSWAQMPRTGRGGRGEVEAALLGVEGGAVTPGDTGVPCLCYQAAWGEGS